MSDSNTLSNRTSQGASKKPADAGDKKTYALNLPKTSFSLRGRLPETEPDLQKLWHAHAKNAWPSQKTPPKHRTSKNSFILHDGPPYANGHLHLGHAVNKIAKDFLVRFARMQGLHAPFTPGWDCHGLPIEAKVEETLAQEKKNKKDLPVLDFRRQCADFAHHWLDIQRDEFLRMGLTGNFDAPYTTMDKSSEAVITRGFLTLLEKGLVQRKLKPVLWSVTEETALAEAEVEYKEVTSASLYVSFKIERADQADIVGAHALIWTTTPWTLPANRAVAFHADLDYVLVTFAHAQSAPNKTLTTAAPPAEQNKNPDKNLSNCAVFGDFSGKKYIVAKDCLNKLCKDLHLTATAHSTFPGSALKNAWAQHPLRSHGYDFSVPLIPATHVSSDAGTGLVHTAPAHGLEDFSLAEPFGLEVTDLIAPNGVFRPHVPVFAGVHIYKAADPVCAALTESDALFYRSTVHHSYPHSWRSRTPLIYRATHQWFLALDKKFDGGDTLRQRTLNSLDSIHFQPASGRKRLQAMVGNRPDWCLSRQRTWGIPLMLFTDDAGQPIVHTGLNQDIHALIQKEGSDAWWGEAPHALAKKYGLTGAHKVTDILDVWFESGMTHAFVLGADERPADVYLEGSDQHRGWFQSSLVLSLALFGQPPFKTLVTHGFVVDDQGKKMSKSLGNSLTPASIIQKKGADVLRLWALSSDLKEDIKVGDQTMARAEDRYRRLRGTFRFLLGNARRWPQGESPHTLSTKHPENNIKPPEQDVGGTWLLQKIQTNSLPALEKWILERMSGLQKEVQESLKNYRFDDALAAIHECASKDLSAFYFDIRKDALYCEAENSPLRQQVQTVLSVLLRFFTTWCAPFLPFTCESVFQTALAEGTWPEDHRSVNLHGPIRLLSQEHLLCLPLQWDWPSESENMTTLRAVRTVITAALEKKRNAGLLKSSLQAWPVLFVQNQNLRTTLLNYGLEALADLCLTSGISVSDISLDGPDVLHDADLGLSVLAQLSSQEKCPRCWRFVVGADKGPAQDSLCQRCQGAEAA